MKKEALLKVTFAVGADVKGGWRDATGSSHRIMGPRQGERGQAHTLGPTRASPNLPSSPRGSHQDMGSSSSKFWELPFHPFHSLIIFTSASSLHLTLPHTSSPTSLHLQPCLVSKPPQISLSLSNPLSQELAQMVICIISPLKSPSSMLIPSPYVSSYLFSH